MAAEQLTPFVCGLADVLHALADVGTVFAVLVTLAEQVVGSERDVDDIVAMTLAIFTATLLCVLLRGLELLAKDADGDVGRGVSLQLLNKLTQMVAATELVDEHERDAEICPVLVVELEVADELCTLGIRKDVGHVGFEHGQRLLAGDLAVAHIFAVQQMRQASTTLCKGVETGQDSGDDITARAALAEFGLYVMLQLAVLSAIGVIAIVRLDTLKYPEFLRDFAFYDSTQSVLTVNDRVIFVNDNHVGTTTGPKALQHVLRIFVNTGRRSCTRVGISVAEQLCRNLRGDSVQFRLQVGFDWGSEVDRHNNLLSVTHHMRKGFFRDASESGLNDGIAVVELNLFVWVVDHVCAVISCHDGLRDACRVIGRTSCGCDIDNGLVFRVDDAR